MIGKENIDIPVEYTVNIGGLKIPVERERSHETASLFRALRIYTGMNRKDFAIWLNIPYNTMCDWESGDRKMPDYVFELIAYKVKGEKEKGNI